MTDKKKEHLYRTLLLHHEAVIARVCRLYGRDDYHFAALYQEVTFALWREVERYGLSRLRRPDRTSGWVYRVACNTAADYMAQHKRRPSHLEADEADTLLPPLDPSEGESLEELIAGLHADDQRLLLLSLQGYSYKEIAAMESLTVSAVGARLSRILDKLRRDLGLPPRSEEKNNQP